MATVWPSARGVTRSRSTPSISAMTAALARREPMAAARSPAVEPSGSERSEPSGSLTVIVADMAGDRTGGPFRTQQRFAAQSGRPDSSKGPDSQSSGQWVILLRWPADLDAPRLVGLGES